MKIYIKKQTDKNFQSSKTDALNFKRKSTRLIDPLISTKIEETIKRKM